MKRIFFGALLLMSTCLFIAAGILQIRSMWIGDLITYSVIDGDFNGKTVDEYACVLLSREGCIKIVYVFTRWPNKGGTTVDTSGLSVQTGWKLDSSSFQKSFYFNYYNGAVQQDLQLILPYWAISLVGAIGPFIWISKRRKRETKGFDVMNPTIVATLA